jgi:hypothetical protein
MQWIGSSIRETVRGSIGREIARSNLEGCVSRPAKVCIAFARDPVCAFTLIAAAGGEASRRGWKKAFIGSIEYRQRFGQ